MVAALFLLFVSRLDFTPTAEELEDVEKRFSVEGFGSRLVIPENFVETVPVYVEGTRTDFNACTCVSVCMCECVCVCS